MTDLDTARTDERIASSDVIRPLPIALVTAALVVVWVGIRSIRTHGFSGFPLAAPPITAPGAPGLRLNPTGYDGQFVYRLALDPFTRVVTAHGITLDIPAYRQQRIATALFAHVLAEVPGISTALALVLVNGAAVVVAVVGARYLTAGTARPLVYAVVLALPAAIPISLGRDLTEPLEWAALILALLAARRGHWAWCAAALTVAVLARETGLIVVGGFGLETLWVLVRQRRLDPHRLWLALPIGVELAWQLWVAHVWGTGLPLFQGPGANSGSPVIGVITGFLDGLSTGVIGSKASGFTYLIERIVFVALMAGAVWQLARRQARVSLAEASAAIAAMVIAVTLRNWSADIQFLRAGLEAWGLSVLILVSSRSRWADAAVLSAGVVTAGVTVLYLHWL